MKTDQTKFNDALLSLILIEPIETQHEGMECGMGFCNENCLSRVTIDEHNDAVLYLRSLYGECDA